MLLKRLRHAFYARLNEVYSVRAGAHTNPYLTIPLELIPPVQGLCVTVMEMYY